MGNERGLDADGYIARESSLAKVSAPFAPVVSALRAELPAAFPPGRLHSAYLYGSIPRGAAEPGVSDLDVLVALRGEPGDTDRAAARALEAGLDARFPQIDGVGAEPVSAATLLSDLERHDLGWMVACLCTPLLGEDLAGRLPRYRPTALLARETNGDLDLLVPRWRDQLARASTPGDLKALGRRVTRRLVRTGFTLVMPRWGGWTSDLAEQADVFGGYYPGRAAQMRAAADAARARTADRALLDQLTSDLAPWLAAEYTAVHGHKTPRELRTLAGRPRGAGGRGEHAVTGDFAYARALQALTGQASLHVDRLLAAACTPAWNPVTYLADFSREVLLPLDSNVAPQPVADTPAGRTFFTGNPSAVRDSGHIRLYVPVTEQTARIGVLAISVPDAEPDTIRQAELLGVFAGLIISTSMRSNDTPKIRRQGRPMSLPASMQWDLLPPWTIRVPGALAAGILEPAYDIAGDIFDYAIDDGTIHFAVIDGMGHGLEATLLAQLAVGAYRHARRSGAAIPQIHVAVDQALASRYEDMSFATGIIGTLRVPTGRLEWTVAGHPQPLLLRGRSEVTELECVPTVPFGLAGGTPGVHALDLKPDDAVLFYTDGVTEAHTPERELFGMDRLTELLIAEAAGEHEVEELLRRMVRAVLRHQGGDLRDDATMLLLRWDGP